jgi:hypothetical protein
LARQMQESFNLRGIEKYRCSARAIYFDFERRPSWQPTLLQLSDQEKILLKVINRYEQIYRQAAFKCLTAANENEPRRLHCNGKKTIVTVFSTVTGDISRIPPQTPLFFCS